MHDQTAPACGARHHGECMTTVQKLGRPTPGGEVLLERDHELQSLDRVVQAARAGEAVLALIEGPAGIGKSKLLTQAGEMAGAAGYDVLRARGSDLERELPYGIVRQLFEPLLLDPDGRERLLSGLRASRRSCVRSAGCGGRGERRWVRCSARSVLADREPRGGAPTVPVDRRSALVRPVVVAVPCVSRAPARGARCADHDGGEDGGACS